jgi:hypothetical protein
MLFRRRFTRCTYPTTVPLVVKLDSRERGDAACRSGFVARPTTLPIIVKLISRAGGEAACRGGFVARPTTLPIVVKLISRAGGEAACRGAFVPRPITLPIVVKLDSRERGEAACRGGFVPRPARVPGRPTTRGMTSRRALGTLEGTQGTDTSLSCQEPPANTCQSRSPWYNLPTTGKERLERVSEDGPTW